MSNTQQEWPPIAIVMYTYDRFECAEPVLRAALDLTSYPAPVQVHIADDGTPGDYQQRLWEIAAGYPASKVRSVTLSNAQRRGYGVSYNLACQATHSHNFAVLALEDDWLLQRPLDLAPLVRTLQEEKARCIRMGYLGFTGDLRGWLVESPAGVLLRLDGDSPEPHVFAGHARLETVAFQQAVGEWPAGLMPGQTEWVVAHRAEARRGVAWPLELVRPSGDLFAHVGTRTYNQTPPEVAPDTEVSTHA